MTRKVVFRAGLVLLVVAIGFGVREFAFSSPAPSFRFVTVERGDIQSTVSTTGTLGAVTTVNVGTQVSGQVSALYVDFNDEVKKGQLLARIDPTIAQQAVADAQANLERLRAQTNQAARDQDRNRELAAAGLIPASQLEQGEAALKVAQASEKSTLIALSRAQQSLSYTNIHAPIDGVVVERNVNLGQTVAASLSAPQLFLIANDLTQMRILAQVGESDIDKIEQGQKARFTVQAIPDRTFEGTVQQVRLQSTTVDNVVNYTVVVSVDNTQGKLLPGMTARANFLTKSADNVLKVANSALRYKPSDADLATLKVRRTTENDPTSSSTTNASRSGTARQRGNPESRAGSSGFGVLYYLDAKGELAEARVKTGITDGAATEISGRNVGEGMKVIAGIVGAAQQANASTSATPFQSGQPQGGQRRGGGSGGF